MKEIIDISTISEVMAYCRFNVKTFPTHYDTCCYDVTKTLYKYEDVRIGIKDKCVYTSGFSITSEHIIFLLTANMYNEKVANEVVKTYINTSSHSRTMVRQINSLQHELASLVFERTGVPDKQAIIRGARKNKCAVEFIGDRMVVCKKNVKCGSEAEGYINYKCIYVSFAFPRMRMKQVEYHFTDMSVVTHQAMHPHIYNNDMCWGNRSSDWWGYIGAGAWDFVFALLSESLQNYYPADCYASITSIRERLDNLNKWRKESKAVYRICTNCGGAFLLGVGCRSCGMPTDVIKECYTCGNPARISEDKTYYECDEGHVEHLIKLL